jgi:triosephosphate isomerase
MSQATRTPVAACNWKMNLSRDAARKLVDAVRNLSYQLQGVDIILAPPFTILPLAADWLSGSGIRLAAQNMHWEEKGAFTGEISPVMLKEAGCAHVLVGHSERRHVFGESDEQVNRKVRSALGHELLPILCVGEKLDEREAGETTRVVERQLAAGLGGVTGGEAAGVIIAYEPVWAIGTGKNASGKDAQEVHRFIRGWLAAAYGAEAAGRTRILYGGSVTPANIQEIIAEKDVDGTLVGGASLKAETIIPIIQSSMKR